MADLILHHYPTRRSPRRCASRFGIKQLAWKSVLIPNIMPKPDLMPLTGGYRKTPVLQVGADIYCDTQLIMLEIEKRAPKPPLLPVGAGGRGAGAGDVDRPQHLLVGGRRGDGRDRRPAARGVQEGPHASSPAARSTASGSRPRSRWRASRPMPSSRSPSRCCATAGRSCSAPCRAWPIARSTIRCGSCRSAWARATRRRRSTGCPRSSNGRSA